MTNEINKGEIYKDDSLGDFRSPKQPVKNKEDFPLNLQLFGDESVQI